MKTLLRALHSIAAPRGDGLRPELIAQPGNPLALNARTGVYADATPSRFDHEAQLGSGAMELKNPKYAARTATHIAPTDSLDILHYATGGSSLGRVLIARSGKGTCAILLGKDDAEVQTDLAERFPSATRIADPAAASDNLAKIIAFVEKPVGELHLQLDLRGTPFQRRVWEKLRAIRTGRTVTYQELARWVSALASPRAVASACVANSIALAIPCHRVVRSDGELGGYRWGQDRKRALLLREEFSSGFYPRVM